MTNRMQEFNAEEECIARNDFLTELHFVDTHEVGRPALRFIDLAENQQSSTLCHCLNLKHARHDRFLGEVSDEEWFVGCDILHADDARRTHSDDLVDELHGIAMGQQLANADVVHHRCLVGIIDRSLHLMLLDFLAHQACKLVVDGVARACGNDTSLDGASDEGHITDDIEQLVTRALVLPLQWLWLDVADLGGIHVGHLQQVGQIVELLLRDLTLVDNDGVLQIAALDEVGVEQWHDIANEDKGTGRGNLCDEVSNLVDSCKLAVDELRLERTHGGNRELVVGQNSDA